ncbi:hypothetical protein HBI18_109490 [Parastagonospora nodorum]|nr:hypothetical protein HBH77_141540 [Parastagonospora nodorum]KAH5728725.1 hypothetical protein HBI18_109490 [Parastagonospora nodorum]
MASKKATLQEHFGVSTFEEASRICGVRLLAMTRDESYTGFTKIQIPFEAPSHPPLPSWDEVEQAFKGHCKPRGGNIEKAFRVGAFLVKFGGDARIFQEAETLLFLQANSQVRAPKVYAAFTRQLFEWTKHFIIMDYIEGETLSGEKWLSLSDTSRSIILSRLCEQFQILRSIPSEGYYGHVHRQGWPPWLSFLRKMQPGASGPFDTYEEFITALTTSARGIQAVGNILPEFHSSELNALSRMETTLRSCNGRQPVLTHMDPSVGNTIIRQIVGPEGKEDWEVTLIDWSEAGWLPAWMQTWCLKETLTMVSSVEKINAAETLEYVEYVATRLGEDYTDQRELFVDLQHNLTYGLL